MPFTTANLTAGMVESARPLNFRILVRGTGVCTIDDVQYGSVDPGICRAGL